MAILYSIKKMIMKGEIVSAEVLHKVDVLEKYIKKAGGGIELIAEISDDAIFFYSPVRMEYLLKINMADINEEGEDNENIII